MTRGRAVVYRGVPRGHPRFAEARRGIASPRSPAGIGTAASHNRGEASESPFTSWTRKYEVAAWHAGEGGVILEWPLGDPPPGAQWRWEWSPDVWHEDEVLIRGTVRGAKVLET